MTTVAAERERLDSTGQLHWGAEAILRTPFSSMSASAAWRVDHNGGGCRFVSEHNFTIKARTRSPASSALSCARHANATATRGSEP